uniref:Uncharacterized protein n=1 Tax=Zosterops lateralis melanops TaxID=1220523 RepID=A0A8D2PWG4_ZOSLA
GPVTVCEPPLGSASGSGLPAPGTSGAPALAGSCLADNRLNLDVYPDGCHRFLQLFRERQEEVVQVEFLRLSSNDCLLDTTLDSLPHLKHLKSLVLKGKFLVWLFSFCTIMQHKEMFGALCCIWI